MTATDATVSLVEGIDRTSSGLLRRMCDQEPDAWRRFVHLYAPLVYKWCRQNGLQDADAGDMGQEVLRAVARSIGAFERGRKPGSFRGWLHTVTRNKILDLRRERELGHHGVGGSTAHRALMAVEESAASESNSQAPTDADDRRLLLRQALEAILADTQEATRRAFWMVTVERIPAVEVAAELGITKNAVYLAKSRIVGRLRREFGDLIDL